MKKKTLTIAASDEIVLWSNGDSSPPSLSELIDLLVEAKNEGGTRIECDKYVSSYSEGELDSFSIQVLYDREETDEEFKERIEEEERKKKAAEKEQEAHRLQCEKNQYAQYLKLKAKFESK